MSNEELVLLIREGVNVQENMGILYQQNKGFIYKLCKPFAEKVDIEDLMQESYFALVNAVDSFDASMGNKFLTYLTWKIRGHCFQYTKSYGSSKRIPVYMQDRISKYKRLINELGHVPDKDTIMVTMNLSEEQYEWMMLTIRQNNVIGFDEPLYKDGKTIGDLLESDGDLEDEVIRKEMIDSLWKQVERLPERQKCVILRRYKENHTQTEIASDEGVSNTYIAIIEKQALNELRNMDELQEIAETFDYDCSLAYASCLSMVRNGKSSNVEYLAMKRLEIEENYRKTQERFSTMMDVI